MVARAIRNDEQPGPNEPVVHTPGPWELREVEGLFAIAHPRGWVLESNNEQQDRADARLIAAAPDLLAACLAFIEADNQCGANLAFVMAQEAVKKAGIAPKENGGETCDMKHGPCSCGATH